MADAGATADVTISGLTWGKVLALVGSVLASAVAIIVVLVNVVYGGITERIGGLDTRVQRVETDFRDAVTSGVKVQDLLTKAPTLEATINKTALDVAAMRPTVDSLSLDMRDLKQSTSQTRETVLAHTEQLKAIQAGVADVQTSVRALAGQLTSVPLAPPPIIAAPQKLAPEPPRHR